MIVRKRCKRDTWYEQPLCCVVRTCQSEKTNFDNHNLITSIHSWLGMNIVSFACNKYLIMVQRRLIWVMTLSFDRNMPIWKKSHFDKSQFDNKHSFVVRYEHCKFCLQQIPHYGNTVFIRQQCHRDAWYEQRLCRVVETCQSVSSCHKFKVNHLLRKSRPAGLTNHLPFII